MPGSPASTQSPTQGRAQVVSKDDPLDATAMESPKLRSKQAPLGRSGSQRRSGTPDSSRHELERTNFHLSEQVKDLKYQLSSKSNEITKLQDNLAARTSEHDDKMKKMREIFAQATKNLDGYRASIAAKDLELQRLRDDLDQCQAREQELRSNAETQTRDTEKLNSEVNSQKALYISQIKQLEGKVRQLSTQLQQTRTDYDQYKKRASQLLQKSNNAQTESARLSELEDTIRQLRVEKTELETEKADDARKTELVEHDIRQALERVQHLEADNEALVKVKEDIGAKQAQIHRLQERMSADRVAHEQAMKTAEEAHEAALRRLKESLERAKESKDSDGSKLAEEDKSNEEREAMDRIMELLHDENSQLRQQLAAKEQELAELTQSSSPSQTKDESPSTSSPRPIPQEKTRPARASEDASVAIDVYASMSHLLSPFVGGGGNTGSSDNRVDLERQVQQLREMLDESEDRVTALRTQEQVLKEEIRKLDSFDRRQNLSIEYLKNVLLKFLQSENKEFMVPVLAKLLSLSADETDELRKSLTT
ncbi:hypothetical protein BDB00DRAFT_830793 [Zychaea mexicana]|uniref:uncharacterized protein n=1 Tax=Zychaea mexicana TaxID=64656 RepID=UPI0022FEC2CC|nr:uncharacterized protein BDB00DRAFT_830793 [Zychaea mexicana]KAI9492017.1 hypothetical protein BDB00DRAFT_830793 [Zychaea mexicana]